MKPSIKAVHTHGGWFVRVRLFFDNPDEHVIILKNKIRDKPVIIGTPMKFSRIYDQLNHDAMLPVDSSPQADEYIGLLSTGLLQIDGLIQRARKTKPRPGPREPKPWNYFDTDARFEHAWITGGTGWGKTSLLSALIKEDVQKVRDGTASVMVIDSQDSHLGHFLPRVPFGIPVIYLEPDLDHPLALNILDFKGYDFLSKNERFKKTITARDMLMFFIGATVGVPSGHMKNIIGFGLRALALMEQPTIFTFKEILVKGRLQNMQKDHPRLAELDDASKKFLYTDMHNANYGPSVQALSSRLDAFDENDFLRDCFSQPVNKFDLYDILKTPHLIVVNLNKEFLGEYQSILGRYFLALLLGVVNARTRGGLDCYVYLDEAHMFIKDEPVAEQLIAQARRARVSLTFAHQWASQVGETAKALQHCGVQIKTGKKKYNWAIQVNQGEVQHINPPFVDFSKIDGMPDPEWHAVIADMHHRYCISPPPPKREPPKGKHKNISEE